MNRLPPEIFFHIIKRLPIKNKLLLKAVCKKWHTLIISLVLPTQHKLSIENHFYFSCKCIDPDHQFKFRDNNSVSVLSVTANLEGKRFFENDVTGVKVLKFCGERDANQVMKYHLSQGPSSSLECLDILYLEEPLVKVLPNLQHFYANSINLVSLTSVLQYCPVLTHLSIDIRKLSNGFVNTFMNLPKGLQYFKLGASSCDVLAVLCSPAMQTLESVLLRVNLSASGQSFINKNARVKPAPSLRRFSLKCYMDREQDRKMIVDLMKECPVLKKIDLRVSGLTLEDNVNIYSRLSNLEMINLGLHFKFDDVIPMILERNEYSLKYLEIGNFLLNLESMEKLAEFITLQTLSFASTLVRILVIV